MAIRILSGGGGLTQAATDALYLQKAPSTNLNEQANGTNAQTLNIYNTTDGTNKEYLSAGWNAGAVGANIFGIVTQNAGTGTARSIAIQAAGGNLYLGVSGALKLFMDGTQFYPNSNNAMALGTGSNVWKTAYVGTAIEGSSAKTLVDGTATIFAKVTIASNTTWGGTIVFKCETTDGTDMGVISGRINVSAVNKAGTITGTVGTVANTADTISGGKTQTLTGFTVADAGSGVLNILCNYTSNIVDSANWPKIFHRLDSTDTAAYAPQ